MFFRFQCLEYLNSGDNKIYSLDKLIILFLGNRT